MVPVPVALLSLYLCLDVHGLFADLLLRWTAQGCVLVEMHLILILTYQYIVCPQLNGANLFIFEMKIQHSGINMNVDWDIFLSLSVHWWHVITVTCPTDDEG